MAFEFQGATIRAREMTIGDEEDAGDICEKLAGGSDYKMRQYWFAQYHVSADVEGDEPFPRIDAGTSAADIKAAYAEWRKLPISFRDLWKAELDGVDKAAKNVSASPI